MQQAAMKKYHVGRAHDADASWEVFRDATRKADDAAFWLKVATSRWPRSMSGCSARRSRASAMHGVAAHQVGRSAGVVEQTIETLALPSALERAC
jgi:hypothetical protein